MRKLLLVGAAVVAAGIFLKRDKVAGLLPSRTEPYSPPSSGPSNYDAPGPVANTATPVPAPEAQEPAAVDEAAEEAAAGAEAANIGGTVSDYAGPNGEPATEAERPLAEAGEGVAEGEEQAELDLETAAEPHAPGMSDTERQIDDTIDQAANPLSGEQVEPVAPTDEPTGWAAPGAEPDVPAPFDEPAESVADDQPTVEAPAVDESPPADESPATETDEPAAEEAPADEPPAAETAEPPPAETAESGGAEESADDKSEGEGGSDWRTWSGRSINP
jgi:hypothetical protein